MCGLYTTNFNVQIVNIGSCCAASESAEEIEQYYRNKYADAEGAYKFGEGEEMSDEITQQGLLPGVK